MVLYAQFMLGPHQNDGFTFKQTTCMTTMNVFQHELSESGFAVDEP